jgi:hypothetical protein
VRNSCDLETNFVSVERLKEMCDNKKEKDWNMEATKPPQNWPKSGKIEFVNLTARYR